MKKNPEKKYGHSIVFFTLYIIILRGNLGNQSNWGE